MQLTLFFWNELRQIYSHKYSGNQFYVNSDKTAFITEGYVLYSFDNMNVMHKNIMDLDIYTVSKI
jgi:hypothetical protein